jgi:hypothetical protein
MKYSSSAENQEEKRNPEKLSSGVKVKMLVFLL